LLCDQSVRILPDEEDNFDQLMRNWPWALQRKGHGRCLSSLSSWGDCM